MSLHRVLEEQEEEDFGQVRGVCPPLPFSMLWSEVAVLSEHRGCNWRVARLPLWPGKHRIRRIVSHYILQVVL